jgi:2,3-bisphosphoglycerate-independent phosphoglycerate mutase
MTKKVGLIILDGWGHGRKDRSNAILKAETPFVDNLYRTEPHSELLTDGTHVGLPEGQMGNSEVGHMNIGAGRVVYQDLLRINMAVEDGSFYKEPILVSAMQKAAAEGKKVHFIGLVSRGGVHSSQDHLQALCQMASDAELSNVFIHAFTDGRDTDPHSGREYLTELEDFIAEGPVKIASVIGRYFAMDRDKRWERVKKAYDLLVNGEGTPFSSASEVLEHWYNKNITDEFLEPSVIKENGEPIATIEDGDIVICFNFRTDRCREITMALTQSDMPEHNMAKLDLHYVTMTRYDNTFKNVSVVYDKQNLANTLGETVSKAGNSQVRIAETEKYPHVTFFFSGGREEPFEGENRILINSPKVATYDLQPEMSAPEVTEAIVNEIHSNQPDFICLNFANPDMVGHTGVFDAIVKACETTDHCLSKVVNAGMEKGYSFVIIADHGNADFAVNDDGSPNTAHTTNPVPIFVLDEQTKVVRNGILADVAPTILDLMGLEQPAEMTGSSLLA